MELLLLHRETRITGGQASLFRVGEWNVGKDLALQVSRAFEQEKEEAE